MIIEPLIGAHVPDQSDGPLGGLQTGNAVRDIVPYTVPRFANAATRDAKYATWVAAGNTLVDGMFCYTVAEQVLWSRIGSSWRDYRDPASGKAWRVAAGNSGTFTADVRATIDLTHGRVNGAMTFDAANNCLVMGLDGRYELSARCVATGGANYSVSGRIVRQRTSVADKDAVPSNTGHKVGPQDEIVNMYDPLVPLLAGDKLVLQQLHDLSAGAYPGAGETGGLYLSARYVAPLNGATPV